MARQPRPEDYTVGWVCALPVELAAAQEMLDEEHDSLRRDFSDKDENVYVLGSISGHNVVMVCLPAGRIGNNPASVVAMQLKATFRGIRFGLMVGIGSGVPSVDVDIRLGDVVVSQPDRTFAGVVQYDAGKSALSGFDRIGSLNSPPRILLAAVARLRANELRGTNRFLEHVSKLERISKFQRRKTGRDVLFQAAYHHEGGQTCEHCSADGEQVRPQRENEEKVVVHYGTIASGNQVIKDGQIRDKLRKELGGSVLCFEMEAAGLISSFPCLVIRGICDYADSHKNKQWQAYAAGTAAAYAKELLSVILAADMAKARTAEDVVRETIGLQKEINRSSEELATALPLNVWSNSLNQHERIEPQFGCQTCDRKFTSNEGVNQHMDAKNHWIRSKYRASDEKFRSDQGTNQHLKATGHGNPNISCKTCTKKSLTQNAANEHIRAVKHENPNITCKTCAKKFLTQNAANEHMRAVGHRNPKISCKTCAKKFFTQSAVDQHMTAVGHWNSDISGETRTKTIHKQSAVYHPPDAFVNAQGGEYDNIPQMVSAKDHEQVTKSLLDKHVNIITQDEKVGTRLKVALAEGHEQVVKPLLEVVDIKTASVCAPTDSGYASQSRAEGLVSQVERNETTDPNEDEEGIENISDNAIESVDFDSVDIRSEESLETTQVEKEGKAHLARFLASDRELGPLCAKVLTKIGRARFTKIFGKVLKTFYRGLLQNAVTEREQRSAHLLQSRRGRLRMGSAIANHFDADEEDDPGKMKNLAEHRRMRAELLNTWIEKMPDPDSEIVRQQLELPNQENEEHDPDYPSSEDLYSDFGYEDAKFPHLADMQRFFRHSRSFQTLLNDVRQLLLPRFVMQVIQTIPKDRIWLSMEQNQSLSNRTKAFIEDYTQLDWDWWPLKPRMRLLRDDETRLFWQCFCGARLWKEISLGEAKIINELLSSLDKIPSRPHRCRVKGDTLSWVGRLASIVRTSMPISGASQRYTPSISALSLSTTGQALQSGSIGQSNANQNTSQQQQQQAAIASQQTPVASVHPATSVQSWVLFGVQGSRRTLEIDHILVHNHSNDSSFYRSLRQQYRANRGRIRLWFSFWRLDYCEVVKFKRIAPEWIIKDCKDLPSDSEYVYDPRPPKATNPPIPRHEFSMHLNACEHSCRWSFLHECMPQLHTSSAIACIPKRRKVFNTASNSSTDVYAWGLEAKHVISAGYVTIYHLIIFLIPFGFWGWWIKKHPDDLQGASVPVTVVFGLLSLFWSTNGILTQGRALRY